MMKRFIDEAIIRDTEIVLVVKGVQFIYTEQMIYDHLAEGWMEDESAICEVDGIEIELLPHHYRSMAKLLHPFGRSV